ncbi:MAG: FimB/Mfa2 family fimbrial subunit [Mediterranea sp.]|jgi:hypothetical protein|nr:FimB/Mfa2 family fimbrial subunit [Mediterranea sp.]
MNLHKAIFSWVLFSIVLLSSCIDESLDGCYGEVTLRFDYPYNPGVGFSDRVSRVNIGIYGAAGEQVGTMQIEKNSLNAFQGFKTRLPEGEYTAICWGNAYANTYIDQTGKQVRHPDLLNPDAQIATDDSLAYGRVDFEVVYGDDNEATVHFEPAVIYLEIAVVGVPVHPDGTLDEAHAPYICLDNLETEIYDFDMNDADTERRTFYPAMQAFDAGNRLMVMRTAVHRMNNDNPVVVDLMSNHTTSTLLKRVALKDLIADNPAYSIVAQKELTIYITYVMGISADVIVHPKPWQVLPVQPNM